MQKHEHLRGEDLSAHLDAALPVGQAGRVREQLARCAHCRAELDALAALRRDLAALPTPRPSPAFAARVLAALPEDLGKVAPAPRVVSRHRTASRAGVVAALVACMLLIAVPRATAGPLIGLLVHGLALPDLVLTWCVRLVVALPSGAAPTLAPLAGGLLASAALVALALRAVLVGGRLEGAVQP